MDLEARRVGCTKSGIWEEDRIKRFVRSPGNRAVKEVKEGKRHEGRDREIDDRQARWRNTMEERKSPFLSSTEYLLFLEDTP